MNSKPKKKIMMTLVGGGHLWQSTSLMRLLGDNYEFCYVTTEKSMIPENLPNTHEDIHRICSISTISQNGLLHKLKRSWKSVIQAYRILKISQPDVIVGVGTSIAVPLLIAAKLQGIPSVFIESITRVSDLSTTGRLILKLKLATRFYVQWSELQARHKNTLYSGTVL